MIRRIYYESTNGQIVMITDATKSIAEERAAYRIDKPSIKVLETTSDVAKNLSNYRLDLSTGKLIQVVFPKPPVTTPTNPLTQQIEELRQQQTDVIERATAINLENRKAIAELYFTVMSGQEGDNNG